MAPTIEEACQLLLQNESDATFQAATETLFKIMQNIVTHPDEPKYRTLKRSTATFTNNLGCAKGAVRLLKAAGFEEQGSDDAAALVLPASASTDLLTQTKAALKAVVKHRMQQQIAKRDAERAAENAVAAQKLRDLKAVSEKNTAKQTAEQAAERERLMKGLQIDREDFVRQRDPTQWK